MHIDYPPFIATIVAELETRNPIPALVIGREWQPRLTQQIQDHSLEQLFASVHVHDVNFADALRSGLLLWNDAYEPSHTIAQQIPSTTGSYWHGIIHRREPDYGNSAYWFRRVGQHPIFPQVRQTALNLLRNEYTSLATYGEQIQSVGEWDALVMIDWCEQASQLSSGAPARRFLERLQLEEIRLLVQYSYEHALGQ